MNIVVCLVIELLKTMTMDTEYPDVQLVERWLNSIQSIGQRAVTIGQMSTALSSLIKNEEEMNILHLAVRHQNLSGDILFHV